MKKTIWGVIAFLQIFFIVGIVGGIDNGAPLTNFFWALVCAGVLWVSIKIGKLDE